MEKIDITFEIERARDLLYSKGIENPLNEIAILLHFISGQNKIIFLRNDPVFLESDQVQLFREYIDKKSLGMPTAYIIKSKEFFNRSFFVDSSVLIPRPETEELIEWILLNKSAHGAVCDLCTGSGCIGLTIAAEQKLELLTLIDISQDALKVAEKNYENIFKNESRGKTEFIESDLFQKVSDEIMYDLIVSNPPYVLPREFEKLAPSVLEYEPEIALVVRDYKTFYEKLLDGAYTYLKSNGMLYLETNPVFIDEVERMMESLQFSDIRKQKDLSGKTRFICGRKL